MGWEGVNRNPIQQEPPRKWKTMVTMDLSTFKERRGDFTEVLSRALASVAARNATKIIFGLHTLFGNLCPFSSLRSAFDIPYLNQSVSESPSAQILTSA